jgi:hypothetical protein
LSIIPQEKIAFFEESWASILQRLHVQRAIDTNRNENMGGLRAGE